MNALKFKMNRKSYMTDGKCSWPSEYITEFQAKFAKVHRANREVFFNRKSSIPDPEGKH